MYDEIEQKIKLGTRVSRPEAEFLYKEASLNQLSQLSSITKKRYHQDNEPTYLIMSIINYTNICVAKCDYCSFYKLPHEKGTYQKSFEEICQQIDSVIALGGTMVGFNGGFHPKLTIQDYAELFQKIRQSYGDKIEFYGMTVAEFMFSSKLSKLSYSDAAKILKNHGSHWITGGGAEILDDDFRGRHSPGKYKVADFFLAQKALVKAGLGSTATMVIGFDETTEERFNHLEALRTFQDESHQALPSFLCWTYKPYNNEFGGEELGIDEYLRWLAISRIFLDNIKHFRTSVLTKNELALEALRYGANDFDLPTEDEVTQKAGATISLDFEAILKTARNLGYSPTMREPFSHLS